MGFRGARGGGNRGFSKAGSRGSGKQFDQAPEEVVEFGTFLHECEGQLVVRSIIDKIPFFNAPIYLKNITQIGKIDEILGPINGYFVSVKLSENFKASSFEKDQKLYIDPRKLLPLERFLPKPVVPKETKKRKLNESSGGRGKTIKKFRDDKGGANYNFNSNRGGFSGNKRGGFGNRDNRGNFSGNRGGGSNRGGSFKGFRGRGGKRF